MNLLDLSQFRYGIDLFNGFNGNPSSWYWAYSPPNIGFINGTTAYSQHPQVRFTTNGTYTVTLIEYRGQAVGIKVRTDYIHADIPGLWTGISSSVWFTASNWHNYMVPNSITDVVIPSAAPHWPVFTGNFIIGIHCHNLRLEGGGNCLMTIREN